MSSEATWKRWDVAHQSTNATPSGTSCQLQGVASRIPHPQQKWAQVWHLLESPCQVEKITHTHNTHTLMPSTMSCLTTVRLLPPLHAAQHLGPTSVRVLSFMGMTALFQCPKTHSGKSQAWLAVLPWPLPHSVKVTALLASCSIPKMPSAHPNVPELQGREQLPDQASCLMVQTTPGPLTKTGRLESHHPEAALAPSQSTSRSLWLSALPVQEAREGAEPTLTLLRTFPILLCLAW